MISLRKREIPEWLHNSDIYKNITDYNEEFDIPCLKLDSNIKNLDFQNM